MINPNSDYSLEFPCRMCLGGTKQVLSLAPTPIANSFPGEPDLYAMRYPLDLRECGGCGHVQIGHHIEGAVLFADYRYVTPEAERVRLKECAKSLYEQFPLARKTSETKRPTVLEIGSNSGLFVEEMNKAGLWAVGIDPSPLAPKNGMPKWFNSKTAKAMAVSLGKFQLVVANNVFSHVDDLRNTFQAIDRILDRDGAVVFEVQYLPDMVRGGMFDMIYHEHKDYHTLAPFKRMLKKYVMCVYKVEHLPTHGGSIRVYVRRGLDGIPLSDPPIDWAAFQIRIDMEGERLRGELDGCKIAAFGATAKACTLIHHFQLAEKIAYCVDETPAKQGRFIPGTNIPIVGPERMKTDKPDAILLTAWNYANVLRPRFTDRVVVPFERAA